MWLKKRILEVYLNVVEFSKGIYGIESAAHYYYKTTAKQLNSAQSSHLAALLPNPIYYQNTQNKQFKRRKNRINKEIRITPLKSSQ